MRLWLLTGLLLAAPATATPPGNVSTMTLPNGGGYMQPGNPNRGITAAGPENALVRHRERSARALRTITCKSSGGPRRCLVRNAGVTLERASGGHACRAGRDWRYDARSITVNNGCRAVFRYRSHS